MKSFFTEEFFVGNRQKLRELFSGSAPVIITGNAELQKSNDETMRFRQDSNFWYLTGVNIPEAVLVMDKGKEYLILPDISPVGQVMGVPYDDDEIRLRSGIQTIVRAKDGWRQIGSRLKRSRHVATLAASPKYVDSYGFYSNPARRELINRVKKINPQIELLDLREHLVRQRTVKQLPELQAIKAAVDITVASMKKVRNRLARYDYEYQIEADLIHGFRSRGASGEAFDSVIASGANSCHPHYKENNASLETAKHLYIDAGAEVESYAADITRTYFLKEPTKRFRAVYDAVEEVAEFAKSRLKPGVSIRDNEQAVEHFMGEKLRELGLIKSINRESVRKYFTHACSHYLGIDVHDVGDYSRPLEAGVVLTVEPGIYIPAEGLGIRIEDDILITKKGCKVLSGKLQ